MSYIRKTTDIYLSEELREVLEVIQSESLVASMLLKKRHELENLAESPINFISISNRDRFRISYLTADRIDKILEENLPESEFWNSSRRYHGKPGATVAKIFRDIPAKEIEIFSNLFKSEVENGKYNFKIVSGEDIKKYYNYKSYACRESGSLGASCMRYDHSVPMLEMYCKNPDLISMVVMVSDEGLVGRALLWNIDKYKIMDRIYTIYDEKFQFHLKKWATDNGYLYKSEQNWYNTFYFENLKIPKTKLKLSFKVDIMPEYYPYLDTFKFLGNGNTLYNYMPSDPDSGDFKTMCATNGSYAPSNYLAIDEVDDVYRYRGEVISIRYLNLITVERNAFFSYVNDQYILKSDAIYCEELGEYLFNEEYDHLNDKVKIEEKRKFLKENALNQTKLKGLLDLDIIRPRQRTTERVLSDVQRDESVENDMSYYEVASDRWSQSVESVENNTSPQYTTSSGLFQSEESSLEYFRQLCIDLGFNVDEEDIDADLDTPDS